MPLGLKRLRKHLSSSRDLYIYSELFDDCNSDWHPSVVIPLPPVIDKVTASPAKCTGATTTAVETVPHQLLSTSTSIKTASLPSLPSLPPPWKLLRIPSFILVDDENDVDPDNDDDPDNNCSTCSPLSTTLATLTTATPSNSFLPESLAETDTLDDMFRLLERLDGRRSRNNSSLSISSSVGSKSHNKGIHKRSSSSNDDSDGQSLLPKVSLSQSYDTADTVEEDNDIETTTTVGSLQWFTPENTQSFSAAASAILQQQQQQQQRRGVTWADQQVPLQGGGIGKNKNNSSDKRLVTRYTWTPLPEQYLRLVILLLHPDSLTFEFVHAEFDTDITISVKQVLGQLSSLAVNPVLQQLEWTALVLRDTQREMINCMTLQEYALQEGSMLIAVPTGYAPKMVLQQAGFFLKDKVLRRVVRRAKLNGRSLRRLQGDVDPESNHEETAPQLDAVPVVEDDKPEEEISSSSSISPSSPLLAPTPFSLAFDASVVVSSLAFDASVVFVDVPSIQDDDFDDFWGRRESEDNAHRVPQSALADHVPAAFEHFIAANGNANGGKNNKAPFDSFTQDLVRLAPLQLPNDAVTGVVQPPKTLTTTTTTTTTPSSELEPAIAIAHNQGLADSSTTTATTNQKSPSALRDTSLMVHTGGCSFTERKATNEELSACSSADEEDSTFADDVLDASSPCLPGGGDKLRLIHSF
jgi:hypothetical protein